MNELCRYRALIFCDLDDTLIAGSAPVSAANAAMIARLAASGVGVVAASGRNLMLLERVLPPELPLAFAICSTGVGIIDWPTRRLLRRSELSPATAAKAARKLRAAGANFMVHAPLPDNHHCHYCATLPDTGARADFYRRLGRFAQSPRLLPEEWDGASGASQLLAIFDSGEVPAAEALAAELRPDYSVVRATSPIDHESLWLEIFAPGVNKASAAAWLCDRFAPGMPSYALGNDYNDLDLLEWADHSLAAAASPPELKQRFDALRNPPENILAEAVERWQLL